MNDAVKHLTRPEQALCGFDRAALAAWLAARGTRDHEAERAALRAFAVAFRGATDGTLSPRHAAVGARWDEPALRAVGVPERARDPLLTLSPNPSLALVEAAPSEDGATRLLWRTWDDKLIESVIIPAGPERPRPRTTLCISSQVGCARACTFCETGAHGLDRQLAAAEIVDQFRLASALLTARDAVLAGPARENELSTVAPISSIVFMGMGEPFDNLDAVLRAVELLCEPYAFAFAPSHITVSTVGVADKIASFFARTRAELAVSLNAPDDARRNRIMPIGRRHDLASIHAALACSMPRGRRVLFQYALFAGWNDALEDADRLAAYVAGITCRVNVIPANPGPDPALTTPTSARVDAFVARLRSRGVHTLVRRPRGRDVGGACGQLAGARRVTRLPLAPSGAGG